MECGLFFFDPVSWLLHFLCLFRWFGLYNAKLILDISPYHKTGSVKPRIFPVLINSRSFCREKVKGHTPAGRGQGDRECSFESLMFLLAAASASVMATGQAILRLYCSNIVVHIALRDGPHCLTWCFPTIGFLTQNSSLIRDLFFPPPQRYWKKYLHIERKKGKYKGMDNTGRKRGRWNSSCCPLECCSSCCL